MSHLRRGPAPDGDRCRYDEHNLTHGHLMDEIERQLRARPIFLVILFPAAVASPWVRREMSAAIKLHDAQPEERVVLPIIAERCDVPLLWSDYKCLAGPGEAGLPPAEAARRVALTLGLGTVRAKRAWDEQGLFEALARCCTPAGVDAARQLCDSARRRGAGFAWGTGELAAVSARYFVGPKPLSVFTLYEWPAGKASFAITFEYLVDAGVPTVALGRLAERLRILPQVADRFAGLEQAAFKKRPALSIDDVLTHPGAVAAIESGIDELLRALGG